MQVDPIQVRDTGARFLLLAACAVIVIAGLKAAASLLLPFLSAGFLALISLPLLNWLQSKKISTPVAVLVTLFCALVILGLVVLLLGGSIRELTAEAPKYKARITELTEEALAWLESRGINADELAAGELLDPARYVDLVTGTLRRTLDVLQNVVLVVLTLIFILFEAAGFPTKLAAALGRRRGSARLTRIRDQVQRYLGIKSLISLITGSIVTAALSLIGVDFPFLWGVLAFLLNYIPTLGSILAAVPPTCVALLQLGVGRALATAAVFVAVNVLLGNLVEPHFMGRRLGLSTLVVFVSLVFWGWVWGPVGMLLSVPLTMILKIMMENTEDLKWIAVLLDAHPRRARGAHKA